VIRRAGPDDSETLLRIQREAAVAAFPHIFPPDRYPFPDDAVHADWQSALADPELEIYIGEIDGEPAASVAVGHGFLRNLYVLPQHQGTGVGSTLHDHALERLRELGWDEAKLWTLEGNTARVVSTSAAGGASTVKRARCRSRPIRWTLATRGPSEVAERFRKCRTAGCR
jgi:GNAT superfamily N-acetyltransferase